MEKICALREEKFAFNIRFIWIPIPVHTHRQSGFQVPVHCLSSVWRFL